MNQIQPSSKLMQSLCEKRGMLTRRRYVQTLATFFALTFITQVVGQANGSLQYQVAPLVRFKENHKAENVAVRSNGQVLFAISQPFAGLYLFDPYADFDALLLESFPAVGGSFGIAELSPDIFYIATGNFTLATLNSTPDSFFVFKVDMRNFKVAANGTVTRKPVITKGPGIPDAGLLNGMSAAYEAQVYDQQTTSLSSQAKQVLLIADSTNGLVWRLSVTTGDLTIAANDTTMKDPQKPGSPAINGLKIRSNYLYYTNVATETLYRIPFDTSTMTVPSSAKPEMLGCQPSLRRLHGG